MTPPPSQTSSAIATPPKPGRAPSSPIPERSSPAPAATPPPSASTTVIEDDVQKPLSTTSTSPEKSEDSGDVIDMETLNQILELDEDDHEFSKGMAWAYFEQAITTFDDMDAAYAAKELKKLSSLGHFLKGSSAALGISKVQLSCERMQHYGDLRDEEANVDLSEKDALAKIGTTLDRVKVEYAEAEKWLKAYYVKLGVA